MRAHMCAPGMARSAPHGGGGQRDQPGVDQFVRQGLGVFALEIGQGVGPQAEQQAAALACQDTAHGILQLHMRLQQRGYQVPKRVLLDRLFYKSGIHQWQEIVLYQFLFEQGMF